MVRHADEHQPDSATRRAGAPEGFPVRRYVVFYRPLVDGIEVVRLLHGARDVTAIAEEAGF
jgi:plasmid stabilization system protein ParE